MSNGLYRFKKKKARLMYKKSEPINNSEKLFGDDCELVISKSGEMYYKEKEKPQKTFGFLWYLFAMVCLIVAGIIMFPYIVA